MHVYLAKSSRFVSADFASVISVPSVSMQYPWAIVSALIHLSGIIGILRGYAMRSGRRPDGKSV